MLSYFELRKGTLFIHQGQPYEVLEFQQVYKAQDAVVARTKIKNLISSKVLEKTFHKGDSFEEAEFEKLEVKFIYANREKFVFAETKNLSARFELTQEQLGDAVKFLRPNETAVGIKFQGKIINIVLPIKIQLKVTEAPPGTKGDRAQSGTKAVTLETGAQIQAPLFVEMDDIIEINTEKGEYVRRVE